MVYSSFDISVNADEGKWLVATLEKISVYAENKMTFSQLKSDFETTMEDFELFWYAKQMITLRNFGLLVL